MTVQLEVLGRTITFVDLPKMFTARFKAYWDTSGLHPRATHPYRVKVTAVSNAKGIHLSNELDVTLCDPLGEAIPVYKTAAGFAFGDEAQGVNLRLADKGSQESSAEVCVWGSGERAYFSSVAALIEALRQTGLLFLHSSGAFYKGELYLFMGQSGTGKSTTLLRALRAGWQPFCEDFCFLDTKTLTVHAWERGLRLFEAGLDELAPQLRGLEWEDTRYGKILVPFEALSAAPRRVTAPLAQVVVLNRPAAPLAADSWQVLSKRGGSLALWEATGLPLAVANQQRAARAVSAVSRQATFWQLSLGERSTPLVR